MMHVVSVLAENKHGVLLRVAGVLCARGVNIERLAACPTTTPGVSRITMAFEARDEEMANIIRRIDRLVNVIQTEEVRRSQPPASAERSPRMVLARATATRGRDHARPRQSAAGSGAP